MKRFLLLFVFMFNSVAGAAVLSGPEVVSNTDWTSAGIGGIGSVGTGNIVLTGVSGTVTKAELYWQGINNSGVGAIYNNPTVVFAGTPIVGVSLGDAPTFCWGDGSSRAFKADVTSLVSGNGTYALSNLATCTGCSANGASLVVFFTDGDSGNNGDAVLFAGNDANATEGFVGEDDGWHSALAGINYTSGQVRVQLHVGDGQRSVLNGLDDNTLVFSTAAGSVTVSDALGRYDGDSVPNMGNGRGISAALWDIHTFEVSTVFAGAGDYTLAMDGQSYRDDCLGLVLLVVGLPSGAAPCAGNCVEETETATPSATASPTRTATVTEVATVTPSVTKTIALATPTATATNTATHSATITATSTPTSTRTSTSTLTATASPVFTATILLTPTPMITISSGCPVTPHDVCRQMLEPNTHRLIINDWHGDYDRYDRLEWGWRFGQATSKADFGDPRQGTSYSLCLYNSGEDVIFAADIVPGPRWKEATAGFQYRDRMLSEFGIRTVSLQALREGAEIRIVGRGRLNNLGNDSPSGNFPALSGALQLAAGSVGPMRMQLINTLGHCWEGSYQHRIRRSAGTSPHVDRLHAMND